MWTLEEKNIEENSNKEIYEYRFQAARFVLVVLAFMFFLNFFLVWARFYDEILILFLPYSYFLFIFTLFLYIIITVKKEFWERISNPVYLIFCLVISLFFIFLFMPFVFDKWIYSIPFLNN